VLVSAPEADAGRPLREVLGDDPGGRVVTARQLALFEVAATRTATKAEAGLAKEIPAGAERLLAALVKHGLRDDSLRPAAALVLALDDKGANGQL
jgi:hypothetical protein